MEAINSIATAAPAPEVSKPSTGDASFAPEFPPIKESAESLKDEAVAVKLSDEAQKKLQETKPETLADVLSEQKKAEDKSEEFSAKAPPPPPPPPPLGEIFYKENQIRLNKSEIELKELEKRLLGFQQYTNAYLAQVAYAKTQFDVPLTFPREANPVDPVERLDLFA